MFSLQPFSFRVPLTAQYANQSSCVLRLLYFFKPTPQFCNCIENGTFWYINQMYISIQIRKYLKLYLILKAYVKLESFTISWHPAKQDIYIQVD